MAQKRDTAAKIRLIAFDLDGTFLDDRKNCIRENMDAIRAAAERGVHIVPCSGRIYTGIPEEIRNLDFVRYCITVNGAKVYDSREDRVIYRAEIPVEDAERIFEYAETLPATYDCYMGDRGWMEHRFYDYIEDTVTDEAVRNMVRKMRTPVDDLRRFVRERNQPLQKIQFLFRDLDRRRREMEEVARRFPDYLVTSSLYNNIEINVKAANKGAGLRALCDHLGIALSETMALGDGGNDVTMLRAAGIGVVMGNAEDEVKACGDVTVGTNEEAGVAEAIRRYVLTENPQGTC